MMHVGIFTLTAITHTTYVQTYTKLWEFDDIIHFVFYCKKTNCCGKLNISQKANNKVRFWGCTWTTFQDEKNQFLLRILAHILLQRFQPIWKRCIERCYVNRMSVLSTFGDYHDSLIRSIYFMLKLLVPSVNSNRSLIMYVYFNGILSFFNISWTPLRGNLSTKQKIQFVKWERSEEM